MIGRTDPTGKHLSGTQLQVFAKDLLSDVQLIYFFIAAPYLLCTWTTKLGFLIQLLSELFYDHVSVLFYFLKDVSESLLFKIHSCTA